MKITTDQRGATLIEAMVAGGLLVTLATGTATLVTLSRRLAGGAEQQMAATAIASSRLDALRAVPWRYDLAGAAPSVPALDVAGSDVLERNTTGHFDITDDAGRPVSQPGAGGAAFVVRWRAWLPAAAAGESRVLESCVFAWPAADGSPPLVCLASARVRQP